MEGAIASARMMLYLFLISSDLYMEEPGHLHPVFIVIIVCGDMAPVSL